MNTLPYLYGFDTIFILHMYKPYKRLIPNIRMFGFCQVFIAVMHLKSRFVSVRPLDHQQSSGRGRPRGGDSTMMYISHTSFISLRSKASQPLRYQISACLYRWLRGKVVSSQRQTVKTSALKCGTRTSATLRDRTPTPVRT